MFLVDLLQQSKKNLPEMVRTCSFLLAIFVDPHPDSPPEIKNIFWQIIRKDEAKSLAMWGKVPRIPMQVFPIWMGKIVEH